MRKDDKRRRRRTAGVIVAFSLAEQMARAVGAVDEDRDDLVATALAVGQWLADLGRPGRWDTLEVPDLVDQLPPDQPDQRARLLFALAGLLDFAGNSGQLAAPYARRALVQIAMLAADPIVRSYARRAARRYREPRAGQPTRRVA